jgi:uncharacterized protein (DUF1778 family)
MRETTTQRPLYSLRLSAAEQRVIAAAAAQRGLPTSTYLRERALEAARRELASPPGERTSS